jgi:anti-sigma factor RsiW
LHVRSLKKLMNESEQLMRRYLLGELSESEQSALEQKYFTDPQAFRQMLEAESELVDSYVRGQASKEVTERIEQSYLDHPARRERVKFAAALTNRIDEFEEPVTTREQMTLPVSWWQTQLAWFRSSGPALRVSVALAILLVMIGGVWIFVESRRRQREFDQAAAIRDEERRRREREQSQSTDPKQAIVNSNSQQVPQPSPNPTESSAPRVVSLTLAVGGVRGSDTTGTPTLVIPPGTTQARLLLNLKDNNYSTYRASLKTINGIEVFSQTNVKPAKTRTGASFVFTVPVIKFVAGDFVLSLQGVNPDGEVDDLSKSLFRVEKR